MAAVSVFVDDAIQGRLPGLCVRTGAPADLLIRTRAPVGGGLGGAMYLLVLFGPPGWLVLVLWAFLAPGSEQITVRLPYTQAAWDDERRQARLRLAMLGLGPALLLMALVRPGPLPQVWLVLGVASLIAAAVLYTVHYMGDTGVYLDGSRRWVTLTRVHPEFARAAQRQAVAARG